MVCLLCVYTVPVWRLLLWIFLGKEDVPLQLRVSPHFTSLKEMGPPHPHTKILQPEWELERDFTQTWQFSRPVWDWRPNNGGSVVGRATSLLPLLRGAYYPLLKLQNPEEFAGTLCPSSQRDTESIAFFSLALLLCLFSWFIEDGWPDLDWGTHKLCPSRQQYTGAKCH